MRRIAELFRPDVLLRRRGGLNAWQWLVWGAVVVTVFVAGSLTASMYTDLQLTSTRCFTCRHADLEQKQYRLKQHIQAMVHASGLDPAAYQDTMISEHGLGRNTWPVLRHLITFPTPHALAAFERQLQDHVRLGLFESLARRERTDNTTTALAITLGLNGAPTDVVVMIQTQAIAGPIGPAQLPAGQDDIAVPPARIAIVIDDMGWDLSIAHDLLDLKMPLSFALMPQAPYQMQIAAEAQRHGHDILVHLPMEPHDYPNVNPGHDALLSQMSPHELSVHLQAALRMLPTAIGVNNHMGSRLTEDAQAMHIVMRDLKRYDLFFLDSRTSAASQAYRIAREVGLRAAQRNVFLDHDTHPKQIAQQLHRLVAMAQTRGYAIGIGHPYPATLYALKQALPVLHQAGIQLVPVSQLVH